MVHLEAVKGRTRLDSDDCVIPMPISLDDVKVKADDYIEKSTIKDEVPDSKYFSIAMGQKRKREPCPRKSKSFQAWKSAIAKIRSMNDPWEKFHFEDFPTEKAIRHRYNALKKEWVKDEVTVRMESSPFGHGAMRECFRMKKLSNFSHSTDWRSNSNNAVAKRYMSPVNPKMYFEEVKLQMDAKLWGEEFNRHNPPKKVDCCQMAVLEFLDKPGRPLYHVENFIEGDYVKYNSNSGFVKDDIQRQTPHAFSHFTFERSGHELMVVDIQGVGDLYTDPQIHTACGTEYGDGNLGTKGMALFFHSHQCNNICRSLGLFQFDHSTSETAEIKNHSFSSVESSTIPRGNEEICVIPSEYERTHLTEFLRLRSSSSICSVVSNAIMEDEIEDDDTCDSTGLQFNCGYDSGVGDSEKKEVLDICHLQPPNGRARRQRFLSESGSTTSNDDEKLLFLELLRRKSKPSCVADEIQSRNLFAKEDRPRNSILGRIHLDLARYHELSRFSSPGDEYDKSAALFHLRRAADCGVLEAVIASARIYLQLPRNILEDIDLPSSLEHEDIGLDYMTSAAEAGDRAAMIFLSKAYDTGLNLGTRVRSWTEAVRFYSKAVEALTELDDDGQFDGTMDDPQYQLIARQAEMYRDGGFGLEINYAKSAELFSIAADDAMESMKGRIASKYYELAEEMSALAEEASDS